MLWLAILIMVSGLVAGIVLRRRWYPKWSSYAEFTVKAAAAVGVALLIVLEPGAHWVPVEVFLAALIVWAFSDWFRRRREFSNKTDRIAGSWAAWGRHRKSASISNNNSAG